MSGEALLALLYGSVMVASGFFVAWAVTKFYGGDQD